MRVATPVSVANRTVVSDSTAFNPTAVGVLQRFLDLCNGRRARFPISGGGQAWGMGGQGDPLYPNTTCTGPSNSGVCNPDVYEWWMWYWQEGRHPYYSSLAAGDAPDMLEAWLRLYADTLPLHQARAKSWYNHSGAVFPER